jgi:C-terminal processing protease CtpA/Prc
LKTYIYILVLTLLVVFNSCGGVNTKLSPNIINQLETTVDDGMIQVDLPSCDVDSKKRFVYDLLHDLYYWADEIGESNIDLFADSSALLDGLKSDKDRFSFIMDRSIYEEHFNSTTANDYGFLSSSIGEGDSVILFVYPNSPAFKAGIKRSDIITKATPLDDNKSIIFTLLSNDGSKKDIRLTQTSYTKREVANSKIIPLGDKKVGYFVLNSFVGKNINSDLDLLFQVYKKSDIDELILDLRYNNGGDIAISAHLATLISGKKSFSHIFQHHIFNSAYSENNSDSYFDKKSDYALDLKRLFVITTENSASASESVISALRAKENDMDVVIIGTKSYGKPYSMYPISFCDKVFFPILMKNFNADYDEDYDDGFTPTCRVDDDYFHDFGDLKEKNLKEAIYYINHESCSK